MRNVPIQEWLAEDDLPLERQPARVGQKTGWEGVIFEIDDTPGDDDCSNAT